MTRACVLEVRGLKVERGGVEVLDVPSFQLQEREIVSLIGPNGSGKTTLLLSMMGLLERTAGDVLYRGREIFADRAAIECRRKMALILQQPVLFDATVYDNVASGLRIRSVPRKEADRKVRAYLDRFNLAHMAKRAARKLSDGEARRVSLARALAVEPEIVFLDEPFSNLDQPTRQSITEDLEKTISEKGMAAVLVTHDQVESLRLSDRIVVVNGGKVVQSGVPSIVMNNPVNEFVASCFGMETILDGVIHRAIRSDVVISVAGKEIHAVGAGTPDERVYCCIRPENVTLDVVNPARTSSARNVFPGTVVSVSSVGPYLKLKLDCGFLLVAHVTAESFVNLGLEEGKSVFASFKATAIHVIRR